MPSYSASDGDCTKRNAALFFYPGQTDGPIATGTRQHDGNRTFAMHFRQRTEEQVDRDMLATGAIKRIDLE
jgi:hypothetical protein